MSLACCVFHTPLPAGKGTGLLRDKGFYGTTESYFACITYNLVWCCALVSKPCLGNLTGRGWLAEACATQQRWESEGETALPGNVEAKVAECSPMDRRWVTRERQAGFIGFCLWNQDGTIRLHFGKLVWWLRKHRIYFLVLNEKPNPWLFLAAILDQENILSRGEISQKREQSRKTKRKMEFEPWSNGTQNSPWIWTLWWGKAKDSPSS